MKANCKADNLGRSGADIVVVGAEAFMLKGFKPWSFLYS